MSELETGKIQKTCRQMLVEFVHICNKYNLRYYPIDGSLLGAVRHSGFIPWDDDVDIGMPRPDYERFCEVAKIELPNNMIWVSYEESLDGNYFGEIAHLFCRDLKLSVNYFGRNIQTYAWIDIMIMYGMPDNKLLQRLHYKHVYLYKGLARMGRIQNIGGRHYSPVEKGMIFLAKHCNLRFIFNTKKLLLHSIKLLKKYDYDLSSAVIVTPSEYGFCEVCPKVFYEPGRKGDFEGIEICLPNHPARILEKLYGDYMTPPPESERKSKHKVVILEENN